MELEKTTERDFSVDRDSGAIVNTSMSAYQAYLAARKKALEVNELKDEVKELKTTINNVENLLAQILEKVSK